MGACLGHIPECLFLSAEVILQIALGADGVSFFNGETVRPNAEELEIDKAPAECPICVGVSMSQGSASSYDVCVCGCTAG
jgi:hypothetical protein